MTPKYTQQQFDDAKTRDLLELECEYCHKQFKIIKKIILENIKNYSATSHKGAYCSQSCSSLAHILKRTDNVICLNCQKPFYKPRHKIIERNFCSRPCASKYLGILKRKPKPYKSPKIIKPPKEPVPCLNCGKLTLNTKYCCGTCRNKVNNQNIKGSKSKAENMLVEALKLNFPQWIIIENNRKILPGGLELDVYIPEIKLAIEWNGIFHYEPIRGRESLEKIINKDNRKIQLCKDLGIELIVICDRTSHIKFIKETINTLVSNLKVMASSTGIAPV